MELSEKHIEFLQKVIHRYYPVSEITFNKIVSIATLSTIKKGTNLIQIGQTAKELHILIKGAVIAYFLDEEGYTYNKNIFLEGDFIGSTVSMLKEVPSEFCLEAIEDCTLISFNYKMYRELININPEMKDFYIAYLEKNWILDKEKREIAIVMESAKTRYLKLLEEHPNIDDRIPLHHIASNLGITPTQLSRIRKELK